MIDPRFVASDPEEVGILPARLNDLLLRVRKEVDEGLLPSAQVAIARRGKLAAFATFGDATNDSLYCVFSSTKAITSAAGWLLIQDGKLKMDELVKDIIPEFGTNGKDVITVEQLYTHTAGFPSAPFRPTDWSDKAMRSKRYRQWRLNWEPGSRFEYHPTSSMWVIAEIIERRSGQGFTDFVRSRIADPLSLPAMYVGLPEDQHHRAKNIVHVGEPMTDEEYDKLGTKRPPVGEVNEVTLTSFNTSDVRKVGVPGGGGFMSAAELALFYQGLLHGRCVDGEEVWSREILDFGTRVITGDLTDPMTGKAINRALGVVVAGDDSRNFRGFGHTNSPLAFGHGGAGGQIAWADPKTGISLGYCTNGHDRHPMHVGRRGISISNRAAVCAG